MEHMSVELRKNIWLFIYMAYHWTLPNRLINITLHIHIRVNIWLAFSCIMACIMIVSHTNRPDHFSQSPCTHRRNTPSARVPLLTARSPGSIYLFAQFPTPTRVLLSRGLSGGSSKIPTHCSPQAFEATFDKLELIRTTLISKMIKTL